MSWINFWIDKLSFLFWFTIWGEWTLVEEEWKRSYADMLDAQRRAPEIEREVTERLLKAIEKEGD